MISVIWLFLKESVPSWLWKAGASVLIGLFAWKLIEDRGASKAVAKIERATHATIKPADAAANKSRSGGVSGSNRIDPTTRP